MKFVSILLTSGNSSYIFNIEIMDGVQNEVSKELQITLYFIVGLISFICNSLIFIVIGTNKKLKTRSNFLLLSLAFTDWLITVFGIPVQIANLVTGRNTTEGASCDLFAFLILVPFLVTNLNMTLIALHRYFMVVRNSIYRRVFTTRNTVLFVATVWLIGLLLALPPLLGWGRYAYNGNRAHCMIDWGYSVSYLITLQVLSYPAPVTTMSFCYYNILRHTQQSKKRLQEISNHRGVSKEDKKMRLTLMLLLVLSCFFFLYFPYAVLILYEGLFKKHASHTFSFLAMLFCYCNSMIDFWIYAVMNTKFRHALCQLRYTRFMAKILPMKTTEPETSQNTSNST